MIAGDREHVGKTRHVHGLVHRRRDGVAFTGDQRRGNRTFVAGQDRADPLVDGFPHAFNECRIAQAQPHRVRRLNRANRAKDEARGSDALKIHVAREVIAAGAQRFERRRQACLELDETAHRRRRPLAH